MAHRKAQRCGWIERMWPSALPLMSDITCVIAICTYTLIFYRQAEAARLGGAHVTEAERGDQVPDKV